MNACYAESSDAIVLQVFVSSPGDVAEERLIAKKVLERLSGEFAATARIAPVFWEHEPLLASASFQDQIPLPSQTDIVVCILWSRLGTRLPRRFADPDGSQRYKTGTEFEFDDALAGRRHRGVPDLLVYRKTAEPVISLKDTVAAASALQQKILLDEFFQRYFQRSDGALVAAFQPFDNVADFELRLEEHLRKLIGERLQGMGRGLTRPAAVAVPTWTAGSPFRGLAVFEYEHHEIFFGRTRAVGDVIERLKRQAANGRAFVLILGTSGCGKSSLVRAGVLPMLVQPGVVEGVGHWRRAIFRPSDAAGDVFAGLASCLLQEHALPEIAADGTTVEKLAADLRNNPHAAHLLLRGYLGRAAGQLPHAQDAPARPAARLVLVLDQLEELFAAANVAAEQIALLFAALRGLAESGCAWILATLRSDFYPRCAEIPPLVELKAGAGQYDLAPPDAGEIAHLVRRPALAAGLRFEEDLQTGERLDDQLRDAAVANRDFLPLLEFTLDELYQRRAGNVLTLAAYRDLGGIGGALARRADEVFGRLPDAVQKALPRVFRELVTVGEQAGDMATRKQAWLDCFDPAQDGATARTLIDAFVAARLLTAKESGGAAVIELAHEALLNHWQPLANWLAATRKMLQVRTRLGIASGRWDEEGRPADRLLPPGKPLNEALAVQAAGFALSPTEIAFLDASRRLHGRQKTMRRFLATAVVLAVLLATGGAFLAIQGSQQRRLAWLESSLAKELEADDWSATHLTQLDAIVSEIGGHSATQGRIDGERIVRGWADSLRRQLQAPSMAPEAVARFEADVKRLESRDTTGAAALRIALRQRLETWEPVFRLQIPFAHLDSVVAPGAVCVEGGHLKNACRSPVIMTKVEAPGSARLEAVFDTWDSNAAVGLLIAGSVPPPAGARATNLVAGPSQGYRFVVRTLPPGSGKDGSANPPPAFALAAAQHVPIALEIYRDRTLLRRKTVAAGEIPHGPLRLAAERAGDRLALTVNGFSIEFLDPGWGDAGPRWFGVEWPADATLREIVALRQMLPESPSQFQRGNARYAQGRFDEALAEYRQQVRAASNSGAEQQIRYQEAMCLLALQRQAEAEVELASLSTEPGDRWPALAACRLWLLRIQQKRFEDGDAIFEIVSARYRLEDLATFVPVDLQDEIVNGYASQSTKANLYKYNPSMVRMCKRAVAIVDFFDCARYTRSRAYHHLLRAYQATGRNEDALDLALNILKVQGGERLSWDYDALLAQCYWILRLAGRSQEALNHLESKLTPWKELPTRPDNADLEAFRHLEKVRLLAALGRLDEAEAFLQQVMTRLGESAWSIDYPSACGIRGCLRLSRHDPAGALQAWKQLKHPQASLSKFGLPTLDCMIVFALADTLSADDVRSLLRAVMPAMRESFALGLTQNALGEYLFPPDVVAQALHRGFNSPRGTEYAQRILMRSLPFSECTRIPVALTFVELVRAEAFAGSLTPEQEALAWETVNEAYDQVLQSGKVGKPELIQLVLAWKGISGQFGWAGVESKLQPSLRGRLGYLLARRFYQLKQLDVACACLRTVLTIAPTDSTLARLARSDLADFSARHPQAGKEQPAKTAR